ncbi:cytochrome P450 9e2-like [Pseudomyrmex gracilis]|uniref:cytochrome P450 9e2-like n=1 Tax=Pseudomyrmex gracilis TaxID=219809 RepID=UPI000994B31A|nr:cytochrome P450 9e2-like [Pseudomyrmex gracilis]
MDVWILLAILAGTIAVYYYFFKDLNYFKKHGVLYMPPLPIVGNMGPVFFRQLSLAELSQKAYNLNRDAKYIGLFDGMNPIVMIRDPELIKTVGVKQFESFTDHRAFIDEANDPMFGKNLFSLRGEKWKDVRSLITPAFTSSKMRSMFTLMSDCAVSFTDFLSNLPPDKRIIQTKDCFTRYTTDVIATCVFGIKVDSMRNPNNEFYIYGKEATTMYLTRAIKFYFVRSMPRISKLLGMKFVSEHVRVFFMDIVRNTIHIRDTQDIVRPDMMQIMIETKGKKGKELTVEDMTSQAFGFFFGGFDTVSTLMCFAAHEIAVHPDVQARLRDEINNVLKSTNGTVTYEALNGMQYLDAVLNETLRLWPVAVFLDRTCTQEFELPPAFPGAKPFVMKKGKSIWFSTYGLHRDPQYWEEPDNFNPDRFFDKKNINSIAYIPFGLGPRVCIGNRFALLETKVMLFHLLARCELKPCKKTCHPLKLDKTFTMQPNTGFWLEIQPRSHTYVSNGAANSHI